MGLFFVINVTISCISFIVEIKKICFQVKNSEKQRPGNIFKLNYTHVLAVFKSSKT
jgi:hypothetical protein